VAEAEATFALEFGPFIPPDQSSVGNTLAAAHRFLYSPNGAQLCAPRFVNETGKQVHTKLHRTGETIMTMKAVSTASRKIAIQGIGAILCTGVLGALFSAQASASCMNPASASGQGSLHQSPRFALNAPGAWSGTEGAHKIVGSWQVSYATEGTVYGEAFIQWHSDGTEWENVDFPILGGNICLGSWKPIGGNKVSRYHVGWLYSDGLLFGHFTETETVEVSRDGNSYTGQNDTKLFQLDGTMFKEIVGTSAATRISP
jgi:hypothetical protein